MKKKILVLLSVLTLITTLSNIAFAGTVDPPPIRELSIRISDNIIKLSE
ncbi:hypothetical protein DW1_2488 [Proteiniborus sp. DW1]|nr:hypothetical protein [Proteiniborus sp. DW1]SCG84052.1 hypothetical protein DW1_2488 [Proteiniborus sp. DW1]